MKKSHKSLEEQEFDVNKTNNNSIKKTNVDDK